MVATFNVLTSIIIIITTVSNFAIGGDMVVL